jgi:allophanate hydrolase
MTAVAAKPLGAVRSLDFATLAQAYESGEIMPEQVVRAVYQRIAARGRDNVWIALLPEDAAVAMARALGPRPDPRKQLWGLPFAIKDNIDVAGVPTTAACPAFAYTPAASATAVARLIEAGAIPIGKTNLDQFATGLIGTRSPYGTPVNPFGARYAPGGSSSGSAVAVAAGLVSFALGTDTAGSGRVPAGFNNIVGVKPTRGLVSTRGVVPACRSLDCVSVFALTAEDALAALRAMAGYDAADSLSDPMADRIALDWQAPSSTFRFGVPLRGQLRFFGDDAMARAFDASLDRLAAMGGERVDIDFGPFVEIASLLYAGPWVAERAAAVGDFIARHPGDVWPATRSIISGAERFSAVDLFKAQYKLAELKRLIEPVWKDIDMLAVPTAGTMPTVDADRAEPIARNSELGYYTNFVNFLQYAAIAVPAAFLADGRPNGITLVAPAFRDAFLAALGGRFHRASDTAMGATGIRPPAPPQPAAPRPGPIALAVVGAHLSGQPLNHQLTERGATLLRACRTAPHYRLYALAGTKPAKPGVLRVEAGGAAIAIEIWSLDETSFGQFVAAVPPPLAIGSLETEDGAWVKGFVCEPCGLGDARDISDFGGWRAYLESGR